MRLVDLNYYKSFILEHYNEEYNKCSDSEVLRALLFAENKVLSWVSACSSYCCNDDGEVVKDAICIFTYDYLEINFAGDDVTQNNYEDNAYLFLKNNHNIKVDCVC